jgi:FAD/FMN-containing dehydrogenase
MSAIDQVHILGAESNSQEGRGDCIDAPAASVVVEAGSTIGDIIRKTMAAGLTVPLGACPSVGAGLWLQGGIGHLARLHGLSCDAIIGAVIISVYSGQILYIGNVPIQHRPSGSIRPCHEDDLLWAVRGAGTNFGIVVSVTFRAHAAAAFVVDKKIISLINNVEATNQLHDFDTLIARQLSRECSADAYLYWNADQLHLGVTTFQAYTADLASATQTPMPEGVLSGSREGVKVADGIELFDAEMYMAWTRRWQDFGVQAMRISERYWEPEGCCLLGGVHAKPTLEPLLSPSATRRRSDWRRGERSHCFWLSRLELCVCNNRGLAA